MFPISLSKIGTIEHYMMSANPTVKEDWVQCVVNLEQMFALVFLSVWNETGKILYSNEYILNCYSRRRKDRFGRL